MVSRPCVPRKTTLVAAYLTNPRLKFGNFVCVFFHLRRPFIPFRRHSNSYCPVDALNAQSVILAFDLYIPTNASSDLCSHIHVDDE